FVSDLVLISKAGKSGILNFVVDRKTGEPKRDIQVVAVSKGVTIASAKTDGDGIAELRARPPAGYSELTLLARNGRDVAATSIGIYPADDLMGYIYSDRPVYRPGHTVHFKAILRVRTADGHEVPAGRKVSVEIDDPDQKPVYHKSLVVSANGTI